MDRLDDSPVGVAMNRRDGREKVTGRAKFAAEWQLPGLCYAVAVSAHVCRSRIESIDTGAAEAAPGVVRVLTFKNRPRIAKPEVLDPSRPKPKATAAVSVGLLEDDQVYYAGQYIACVVAESLEEAQHAARLIRFTFQPAEFVTDPQAVMDKAESPGKIMGRPAEHTVGDPDRELANAPVRVDNTYSTPREQHNPIEPHSTVAAWSADGSSLTVHEATQHIVGVRGFLAESFGLEPHQVTVLCPYTGGGFGCKGSVWPHVGLAAMAAKAVNRPVKLMLTREQMFGEVGHRTPTIQRVALGADDSGRLVSLIHEGTSFSSRKDTFVEPFTTPTQHMYASPNRRTAQKLGRLDILKPTFMRAPGEAPGTFALECAMDELAYALKIDPIELRRRNEPETDPESGQLFSSRRLMDCFYKGAESFGWSRRNPEPRAVRDGHWLVGIGCAAATYPSNQFTCSARIRLMGDGTALVTSSTQELGTGTATVQAQLAAEALGLPVERVRFSLGDSRYPDASVSGGSSTSVSVGNAVLQAASRLKDMLLQLVAQDEDSPLRGASPESVEFASGLLRNREDHTKAERLEAILGRHLQESIEADATATPVVGGAQERGGTNDKGEKSGFAKHSFGAQFCEVGVDEDLGIVRIRRFLGCFACGRILNAKTGRSQFIGGITMGVGMALLEDSRVDHRTGRVVNASLSQYLVPCHADAHEIDAIFLEDADYNANPTGAKGIGEIGITGAAAAVANAVFNATGKRIRDLPITCEKLI